MEGPGRRSWYQSFDRSAGKKGVSLGKILLTQALRDGLVSQMDQVLARAMETWTSYMAIQRVRDMLPAWSKQ